MSQKVTKVQKEGGGLAPKMKKFGILDFEKGQVKVEIIIPNPLLKRHLVLFYLLSRPTFAFTLF